MHSKLLADRDGLRTFVLVLQTGDEAMSCLRAFPDPDRVAAAPFSGIAAFSATTLNYFDWERKEYCGAPVTGGLEVASLKGDTAVAADGRRAVRAHLVLGRRDKSALAGHQASGNVRPALEIVLTEAPTHLRKTLDSECVLISQSDADGHQLQ